MQVARKLIGIFFKCICSYVPFQKINLKLTRKPQQVINSHYDFLCIYKNLTHILIT